MAAQKQQLAAALGAQALGSRGARSGVEANTNFPPEVVAHVQHLTDQGMPMDQAMREAEISYVGARPTMAHVTRDPVDQRAVNEGAKLDTPEGQVIAAQLADNNAALHRVLQGDVVAMGGVPAAGEVTQAAAQSLARRSGAERADVSRLYDLAALEHGRTAPESIEPNIADTSSAAPTYWDQAATIDAPDERDVLSPSVERSAYGKPVYRRGPMDMVTWLRTKGGIRDQAGELAHAHITNKARDLDFARNEGFLGPIVNPKGMTLDDAAHDAWEAGFFPNHSERPDIREFLDALTETHRGGSFRAFRPEDLDEIDQFERTRDARYEAEQRAAGMIRKDDTAPRTAADMDAYQLPMSAYLGEDDRTGGTVSLKPLQALLNEDVSFKAPVTPEGRALVSGLRRATNALSSNGTRGVTPAELERLRKIAGGVYNPMGGEVNHFVGRAKGTIDSLFDEPGEASPAYKAARLAHKAWAERYEQPTGVFKLIRRDSKGNILHDENWRRADNALIGSTDDRAFGQIVRQLHANGDDHTLRRLKASVIQRAYEASTGARGGTALDQRGNSLVSGRALFAALDQIGQPKLRALFTPAELGRLATIGRAAAHLNEAVPGTFNGSGSGSTVLNALKRMNGAQKKTLRSHAIDAGLMIGGQIAGHAIMPGVGGAVIGMAGNAVKAGVEHGRVASAGRQAAAGIKQLAVPAEARAANHALEQRLAQAAKRRATSRAVAPYAVQVAVLGAALRHRQDQQEAQRAALAAGLRRAMAR